MLPPRKQCRYCRRRFRPDPRTGERQYACSLEACQHRRQKDNQDAWLADNPDYFEGRSVKLREWREAHPGYSAEYRRQHPEAAKKHRESEQRRRQEARARNGSNPVAKQEEIRPQVPQQTEVPLESPGDAQPRSCVAEQEEIFSQHPILLGLIEKLQPVAKPNHIDLSVEACYRDGLHIRASRLALRSASRG